MVEKQNIGCGHTFSAHKKNNRYHEKIKQFGYGHIIM